MIDRKNNSSGSINSPLVRTSCFTLSFPHPRSIIHAVNPVPVPLLVRLQPACGQPLGQVVGNTLARNQAVGPRVESQP